MWIWFAKAPWWLLCLIAAVFNAACWLMGAVITNDMTGHVLYIIIPPSLIAGLMMGLTFSHTLKRTLTLIEDLPRDKLRAAERASRRGPAPSDEETRRGALSVAEHRFGVIDRSFTASLVMLSIILIGCVASSVFATPWFSVLTVLFAATMVLTVRQRSQFQRQVVVLADSFVH
ncbi:MAG: hypothetical protein JWQ81_2058 [Amycolatopsis sp.]|uniref:hypothetical protein n=1 Tax=Amycolatopsis sp. TaxID=37632 RepID=UPI00260AC10D|nr:hypothetical protein [Amycolatopsis sp.]MCU1681319.1 hypothetical protein [Amycolatopsis sp.]